MTDYAVQTKTVAVTTATEVFNIDATFSRKCWVQIDNLSGSQNFTGTIQLRLANSPVALPWASSSFPDFSLIAPGASVVGVIDTERLTGLRMIGSFSGAGDNVQVTVKDVPR